MGTRILLLVPPLLLVAMFASLPAGEIGPDRQISTMDDPSFVSDPAVAYSPVANGFLAVWRGDDGGDDGLLRAIYGQLLDAESGAEVGDDDFKVNWDDYRPINVDIAYNSTEDEYLVVWDAYDDSVGLWAVRLESDGTEVVSEDQIRENVKPSTTVNPSVAYNSIDNEYLVVWEEDTVSGPVVKDQIFGQVFDYRLRSQGDAFQISTVGPSDEDRGKRPDVAYNVIDNEYLVVWGAELESLDPSRYVIQARRVTASGIPVGTGGYEIFPGATPAVAHNAVDNQYLVVRGGYPVRGQRLIGATGAETGAEILTGEIPLPDWALVQYSNFPDLVHNPLDNEYLVVWTYTASAFAGRSEDYVYGQRLAGTTGSAIGGPPFTISETLEVLEATAAYDSTANRYAVAWNGSVEQFPNIDYEVFIQLYAGDDVAEDREGLVFSTRTTQYGISDDAPIHLFNQNCYEIEAAGEPIEQFVESFLPRRIGLDAIDVRSDTEALFSVRPGGTIRQATGRMRLYEGTVYKVDMETGLISEDPMAPVLPTIDALDLTYEGYAISTDVTQWVSYPGGIKKLFHDAVYIYDPLWTGPNGSPFTRVMNGGAMHINGIDAVDVLRDGRIAFSPAAVSHVPTDNGLMRLYDPNVYVYDPDDGSISMLFNVGAYHVDDLDAVTLREGMEEQLAL